jgi:RsiW-degrading membrane proteinase PrsW (M82 family)
MIAGVAIALISLAIQLPLFLQDGPLELLRGVAQQLWVMVLLLLVTAATRTVSLGTLGLAFLVGALPAMALALLLEWPPAVAFGVGEGSLVLVLWVPPIEEAVKLLPVGLYLYFASSGNNRQPAITDGLLVGFAVGAGFAFYEDGLAGEILSGDGWTEVLPWSLLLPTLSDLGNFSILNHGLWTALTGLGLGVAFFFRPRRWAYAIAALAFVAVTLQHMVFNYFAGDFLSMLEALGRAESPPWIALPQLLLANGLVPILAVVFGTLVAVAFELRVLDWVSDRAPKFPSVSLRRQLELLAGATSVAGFKRLRATTRYARQLRAMYYAAWRAERLGAVPTDSPSEIEWLAVLADRAELVPGREPARPADAPSHS